MEQYYRIKEKYKEEILFFRLGDFYEMFHEDAKKVSKILGIALTKRNGIPMCGIPYHTKNNYLPKILRVGYKIAICDQLRKGNREGKVEKGLMERGVTEVITPGMILDEGILDGLGIDRNNYIMSFKVERRKDKPELGVCYIDISTGDFYGYFFKGEGVFQVLVDYLYRVEPRELLMAESVKKDERFMKLLSRNQKDLLKSYIEDEGFNIGVGFEVLKGLFRVRSLKGFGVLGKEKLVVGVAGALVNYIRESQMEDLVQLKPIKMIRGEDRMFLNGSTLKHLELVKDQEGGQRYSLYGVLNQTKTVMGKRLLYRWILSPLTDCKEIGIRQEMVSFGVGNPEVTRVVRELFIGLMDMERLRSKLLLNKVNPRDLLNLKDSLMKIESLLGVMGRYSVFKRYCEGLESFAGAIGFLERGLKEDASIDFSGEVVKSGYHKELDRLRELDGLKKKEILELQASEKKRLGISHLRVKYNRLLGYFIEIPRGSVKNIPVDYIEKQKLTNVIRYTLKGLAEKESEILSIEETKRLLEREIFESLRLYLCEYLEGLKRVSEVISELDILLGFSWLSLERGYEKPLVDMGDDLILKGARHPVVEYFLGCGDFITNDTYFEGCEVHMITGPNMSGKSTYLRQVALLVIMAQVGCFIPVEYGRVGVFRNILTRIGAWDNLAKGESTFLVEMMETAYILNNIEERSLVVMDEIGRGTSTYDGLAIAWSIIEYLSKRGMERGKVLFATHYHELAGLSEGLWKIKNYRIEVKECEDEIIFLYKVKEGSASRSYGVQVARLAGVPVGVIERAEEVLEELKGSKGGRIGGRIGVRGEEGVNKGGVRGFEQLTLFSGFGVHKGFRLYRDLVNELLRINLRSDDYNLIIEKLNILQTRIKKI